MFVPKKQVCFLAQIAVNCMKWRVCVCVCVRACVCVCVCVAEDTKPPNSKTA